MARTKSHKEDEDLKGIIRELRKENAALRRRLKKLERNRQIWEQYNLDADEMEIQEDIVPKETKCDACKEGTLMAIDLGLKYLTTCSNCKFRKTRLK